MNAFEGVKNIRVLNDKETDVLAIITMQTPVGPATTFLMELCVGMLERSFKVFFPEVQFEHYLKEEIAEIIFYLPERWTLLDEQVLDRFFSALIMRNPHISLAMTLRNSGLVFGT